MYKYIYLLLKHRLNTEIPAIKEVTRNAGQDGADTGRKKINVLPGLYLSFAPTDMASLGHGVQEGVLEFTATLKTDCFYDDDKRYSQQVEDHYDLTDQVHKALSGHGAMLSGLPQFASLKDTPDDYRVFNSIDRVRIDEGQEQRAIMRTVQTFKCYVKESGNKTFQKVVKGLELTGIASGDNAKRFASYTVAELEAGLTDYQINGLRKLFDARGAYNFDGEDDHVDIFLSLNAHTKYTKIKCRLALTSDEADAYPFSGAGAVFYLRFYQGKLYYYDGVSAKIGTRDIRGQDIEFKLVIDPANDAVDFYIDDVLDLHTVQSTNNRAQIGADLSITTVGSNFLKTGFTKGLVYDLEVTEEGVLTERWKMNESSGDTMFGQKGNNGTIIYHNPANFFVTV